MIHITKISAALSCAMAMWTLAGCAAPMSGGNALYALDLADFPNGVSTDSIDIVFQTRDQSGALLDNVDLGTKLSSDSLQTTQKVNLKAATAYVYLLNNGYPSYFAGWDLVSGAVRSHQLSARYWLDYDTYFSQHAVRYGFSEQQTESLSVNELRDLNFEDKPYYLFQLPQPGTGQTYQTTLTLLQGQVHAILGNTGAQVATGEGTMDFPFGVSQLASLTSNKYALLYPEDYTVPSEATLISADITELLAQQFDANQAVLADSGQTIIFAQTIGYWNTTSDIAKTLRRWNLAANHVEVLKTFDSVITALTNVGSDVYIGAGSQLYRYRAGTCEVVATMPDTVVSIIPVGDGHLLVAGVTGTTYVSGGTYHLHLVRLSDFQTTSSADTYNPSATGVWVPEQSRLYMMTYSSDAAVWYQQIDLSAETLGTSGDSPYQYSIDQPFNRLGSDLAIMTRTGRIFRIDDSTDSKIAYSDTWNVDVNGIVATDAGLLTLETVEGTPSTVSVNLRSATAPYAVITTPATWQNELGVQLLSTGQGIIAVTTDRWNLQKRLHPISPDQWAPNVSASISAARHIGKLQLTLQPYIPRR
jgi:hypothetical protein